MRPPWYRARLRTQSARTRRAPPPVYALVQGRTKDVNQAAVGVDGLLSRGHRSLRLTRLGQAGTKVAQRAGEGGQVGGRVDVNQAAADGDSFLSRGQRRLPLTNLGQPVAEVVQRAGQGGQVGVRVD